MRRSRFSEEQIVGILKEQKAVGSSTWPKPAASSKLGGATTIGLDPTARWATSRPRSSPTKREPPPQWRLYPAWLASWSFPRPDH
jgi:hypothetical protein